MCPYCGTFMTPIVAPNDTYVWYCFECERGIYVGQKDDRGTEAERGTRAVP